MARRHSHDEVARLFAERGCVLTGRYVNSHSPVEYICQCGREAATDLSNFLRGIRCGCRKAVFARRITTPYEVIARAFSDQGCKLVSDTYTHCQIPLRWHCSCGNKNPRPITFDNFRRGKRCGCRRVAAARKQAFSHEFVRRYFADRGCQLLSESYVNVQEPLEYICSCGRHAQTVFTSFLKGHRCQACGHKRATRKKRARGRSNAPYTLAAARSLFETAGCVLLATEYTNRVTPMPWICSCGNTTPAPIRFGCFLRGARCKGCWGERMVAARRTAERAWDRACGDLPAIMAAHQQELVTQ